MTIQFNVPDMSCGHCVSAITAAVQQVAPGATVTTDLASHKVSIEGSDDTAGVQQAILDAGYDAQPV